MEIDYEDFLKEMSEMREAKKYEDEFIFKLNSIGVTFDRNNSTHRRYFEKYKSGGLSIESIIMKMLKINKKNRSPKI
jgi:hypothetical protein